MSDLVDLLPAERQAAATVLACYPSPLRVGTTIRRHRGGFSGAAIHHVSHPAGDLCLRAWPPHETDPERLAGLHRFMEQARDAGLAFVPRVYPTTDGRHLVQHDGRWWELQEWMPGVADFHAQPSPTRRANACIALARLHSCWAAFATPARPCAALQRRLDGWRLAVRQLRPVPMSRAERVLARWLPAMGAWLEPWVGRVFPAHPCLCDVWRAHVLFADERVTGLIDYGAVKIDNAAADLARLLGSLVEDDEAAWHMGLAAYRSVQPLSADEEQLARALDRAGTVLGVANWLQRFAETPPTAEALRRLDTLVRRVETW